MLRCANPPVMPVNAELLHTKGSFWLQTVDQSGRRSVFLQQEQQKFNLDPEENFLLSLQTLTMLAHFRSHIW